MSPPADDFDSQAKTPLDEEPRDGIPDDPRLAKITQEYLHELESGRRPDRRKWLEQYPNLSDALEKCLDGLELVYRAAPLASPLSGNVSRIAASPNDPTAMDPLGDFKIVREMGRGGMGIVYEAVQLSLGRRVAIKVLPFAATFDAKHLQRFRQEAQAAAQLHHTNIVPVYAVGCERGIHFYAMQLIDGQSLDTVIQQLRQQSGMEYAGPPTDGTQSNQAISLKESSVDSTGEWKATSASENKSRATDNTSRINTTLSQLSSQLSTFRENRKPELYRTIARYMAQAAEALEYAHQQGVVHRDIKPANLLIDSRGNVWITDFGLAHFHDAPGLTQTGDILGTIRYMSPEQASGQRVVLDHRTDIYSLAATFYEVLTLHPVFEGKTRHGLLADVLTREPRSPRSLDPRLPVDLDIILLKALNKNPGDRYATSQELADDLHRFLRDEPIRATRPSLVDKTRKWARRHPSFIAATVLVMFMSLVGSLFANWLITQANDRTKAALAQEKLRAEEAEKSFQQAREAVDLLIEVGQVELSDEPPLQGIRKRLLETALVYYQDFINQRRDNPSSQSELIAVQTRLKRILDDLSVLEGAGQLILLSNSAVQNDLRLDHAQTKRIENITQEFDKKRFDSFGNFNKLSPLERRTRFIQLARENDQAMRTTLTPLQLERLEQITLQLKGPRAFSEPEVIAKLHLSDLQRQTIRQIEMEAFASMWDRPHGMRRGGPNDEMPEGRMGPPPDEQDEFSPKGPPMDRGHHPPHDMRGNVWKSAMEKILQVLTPEQLAIWKQMTGQTFQGSIDVPPLDQLRQDRPPKPPLRKGWTSPSY